MRQARKQGRSGRRSWVWALLLSLFSAAAYWLTPWPISWEIARLSRPETLASLPERGANPRLNQLIYEMALARSRGHNPTNVLRQGVNWGGSHGPRQRWVEASLERNFDIATRLGLLTSENLRRLERGRSAIITTGPYQGELAEVDHIVPVSLAPELGNELANLELTPASLNRRKSNRVGQRQWAYAQSFHEAGLLTPESLERLRAKSRMP